MIIMNLTGRRETGRLGLLSDGTFILGPRDREGGERMKMIYTVVMVLAECGIWL